MTNSKTVDVAFSSFYGEQLDAQVRRAYLMLSDNEAANDVVHEAMIAVYRRWDTIDQPAAYLNRSVLNGCRDVGRRRNSSSRLLARIARNDVAQPASDSLADLLSRLPYHHRAAIVLRFYSDFSTREIAEALDCAPGSVGPWIERGLLAMKKAL